VNVLVPAVVGLLCGNVLPFRERRVGDGCVANWNQDTTQKAVASDLNSKWGC
jgi:hypothetical protein